jgi:hypothetical protein
MSRSSKRAKKDMSAQAPGPRYERVRNTCYVGAVMHMVGFCIRNAPGPPRDVLKRLAVMITDGLHDPPHHLFNTVLTKGGAGDHQYKGDQDDVAFAFATFVGAYKMYDVKGKAVPDFALLGDDCATVYDSVVTCDAAGHEPMPPDADGKAAASAAEAVPVIHTTDHVLTLPLIGEASFTVGGGLDKFFAKETLQFKCETEGCDSRKSTREYMLHSIPVFLVMTVNRSLYYEEKSKAVVIPEALISFGGYHYVPAIIVLHHGDTAESGHYTVLRRSDNGEWWHYNDHKASKCEGGFAEIQKNFELMAKATVFLYHIQESDDDDDDE